MGTLKKTSYHLGSQTEVRNMKWDKHVAKLVFVILFVLQMIAVIYFAYDTSIYSPGVRLRLILPAAYAVLSILGLIGVVINNSPVTFVYVLLMLVALFATLYEIRQRLYSPAHIAIWEGHALMVMVASYAAVRGMKGSHSSE